MTTFIPAVFMAISLRLLLIASAGAPRPAPARRLAREDHRPGRLHPEEMRRLRGDVLGFCLRQRSCSFGRVLGDASDLVPDELVVQELIHEFAAERFIL